MCAAECSIGTECVGSVCGLLQGIKQHGVCVTAVTHTRRVISGVQLHYQAILLWRLFAVITPDLHCQFQHRRNAFVKYVSEGREERGAC